MTLTAQELELIKRYLRDLKAFVCNFRKTFTEKKATCGLKQEAALLRQNLEKIAKFLIVHTRIMGLALQYPANFLHFLQSENIG